MNHAHVDERPPARRVRHEVADGIALMAFSLTASTVVAVVLSLVVGSL